MRTNLLSQLYGYIFVLRFRMLAGFSWLGWLLFGLGVGMLFALTRGLWLTAVLLLLLFSGLILLNRIARRNRYILFSAEQQAVDVAQGKRLRSEERVLLRVTGTFSVTDSERFVVLGKAHYWFVPLGEHVFMVTDSEKKHLYQFIKPADLLQVTPGELRLGPNSYRSLEIVFHSNWSSTPADHTIAYYVGSGQYASEREQHTIYLSFENEETRQTVWRVLQPQEE